MTRFYTLVIMAAACGPSTPSESTMPERPPSVADPAFVEQYAQTGGFRLGQPASITIVPDGSQILFLRSGARDSSRSLYAYDVASGEERQLLTAAQILQGATEELSAEERALRERLRMNARGITSFRLNRDASKILVPLSGRLYLVEREGGAVRELPSEGGYANDARFSPDGTKVSCVRDGDIWVIDIASGAQQRLTNREAPTVTNGLAEFVAQEEMSRYRGYWWSPDSSQILYQRNDSANIEVWHASNPIHPAEAPHAARYPQAGTANADVKLGVIAASGGPTQWIEWDREALPYLATVRWSRRAPLTLLVQDRLQQRQQLLRVNLESGASSVLHEETDAAWLNLDQSVPHFYDADRWLWSTERSGRWQLELHTGDEARFVSAPEHGYFELAHASDDGVWIVGSDDASQRHIWRIPFEGEPQRISEGDGFHDAVFGRSEDVWVHAAHTTEHGPRWFVKRGTETVGEIASASEEPPFVPNVEYLRVGEKQFRAVVIRPRNFEQGRSYPVILSVYAGPGHTRVRIGRYQQLREQWQADHGYIVVSLDGRGTPGRGREWERVIRRNLIDVALADQVEGLQALATEVPEMDLSRVGVYGWSFGGYFSAMAVMRRPDIFKVGVAGAPVCDWVDYDTHYTERFMDLPENNAEGYRVSNVLTYAPQLERPLMIVHGTSDDNVYFVHAMKMHDALMRAGRDHDFVVLAGSTHMVADADVARALEGRIMRFLSRGLTTPAATPSSE